MFIKSKNRIKPEEIMTSSTQSEVISDICDSITTNNDIKSMLKLAKKISQLKRYYHRNENSLEISGLTRHRHFKWILFGPCVSAENDETKEIESLLNVTAQFILQNIKTNRQTNYHLQQNSKTIASKIEAPLNIGFGIAFYHATRGKKLANFLPDLNVSASYQKVIGIKKNIYCTISIKMKS